MRSVFNMQVLIKTSFKMLFLALILSKYSKITCKGFKSNLYLYWVKIIVQSIICIIYT